MNIQALFDAISTASRATRKDYHLTLDGLISVLAAADQSAIVQFSDGSYPGGEHSYRGYYDDLAFSPSAASKTVAELLKQASAARGETYEGYKGGDFVMDGDTPLWCAGYGDCGEAIVGIVTGETGVTLVTKDLDA